MRSIVINGDKFEIREFKNFLWVKKNSEEDLPEEFQKNSAINENIEQTGSWYLFENCEYRLYAFLSDIGVQPHPLIKFSCVSTWYNSNLGGVYVTGKDKKTGAFFAPVIN